VAVFLYVLIILSISFYLLQLHQLKSQEDLYTTGAFGPLFVLIFCFPLTSFTEMVVRERVSWGLVLSWRGS